MKKDLKNLLTSLPTNLLTFKHRGRKAAFTLAETLITLGIIGIVAVLVLPSFIAKYQERVYISKIRKAYYSLDQAVRHAVEDNGPVDTWPISLGGTGHSRGAETAQIIFPYFDGAQSCKGRAYTCFSNGYKYKTPNGGNAAIWVSADSMFMLKDGTAVNVFNQYTSTWCTGKADDYAKNCGTITVDITGSAGPNVAGKDYINFYITKTGVVPIGRKGGYYTNSFERGCLGLFYNCSAWVIYNDNMDYLHCPEKLGWDKAHSCKD